MIKLAPHRKISGELTLPGDKSISHRAALMSLLCSEPIKIRGYADNADCQTTLDAVQKLGVEVKKESDQSLTLTPGHTDESGTIEIDCGNSGTTARLITGLLAGKGTSVRLSGDESLSKRPMRRVVDPLEQMGAKFEMDDDRLPLVIQRGAGSSIDYRLPTPSAQIKSAVLLAACSGGVTAVVTEDTITRDHTERMLTHLGANIDLRSPRIEVETDSRDPRKKRRVVQDDWKKQVVVRGNGALKGAEIDIPGDISTAAFFLAAGAISEGEIVIHNVGLNPTRTAFLDYLESIGCGIAISNRSVVSEEPRGTIKLSGARMKGRKISGQVTASLIDELPIIAVIACFANGTTVIRDAAELRVKESDRIESIATNLRKMGAKVGVLEDGLVIETEGELQPADFESFDDHRIAMAMSIASLFLPGDSTLDNESCIDVSCPGFYDYLNQIKTR